jgi:hypothetical protein
MGLFNQLWHKRNSAHANFTSKDQNATRDICPACVKGKMRAIGTDPNREHRPEPERSGQQFSMDTYTHNFVSRAGNSYAHTVTDFASRRTHVIFVKSRTSAELIAGLGVLFRNNPQWFIGRVPEDKRFWRLDQAGEFMSVAVSTYLSEKGYVVEPVPRKDKHANGIAERKVGLLEEMTNVAMLAVEPPVPNLFWV